MTDYVLSEDVELDLDGIWEHIANDSIEAADRWIDVLFRAFEMIGDIPGIGHTRKDLTTEPVLFWPVGAYLIIYRQTPVRVEIVAVTQGARDLPRFLHRRLSE